MGRRCMLSRLVPDKVAMMIVLLLWGSECTGDEGGTDVILPYTITEYACGTSPACDTLTLRNTYILEVVQSHNFAIYQSPYVTIYELPPVNIQFALRYTGHIIQGFGACLRVHVNTDNEIHISGTVLNCGSLSGDMRPNTEYIYKIFDLYFYMEVTSNITLSNLYTSTTTNTQTSLTTTTKTSVSTITATTSTMTTTHTISSTSTTSPTLTTGTETSTTHTETSVTHTITSSTLTTGTETSVTHTITSTNTITTITSTTGTETSATHTATSTNTITTITSTTGTETSTSISSNTHTEYTTTTTQKNTMTTDSIGTSTRPNTSRTQEQTSADNNNMIISTAIIAAVCGAFMALLLMWKVQLNKERMPLVINTNTPLEPSNPMYLYPTPLNQPVVVYDNMSTKKTLFDTAPFYDNATSSTHLYDTGTTENPVYATANIPEDREEDNIIYTIPLHDTLTRAHTLSTEDDAVDTYMEINHDTQT